MPKNMLRRSAAALALAVGVLSFAVTGASAAEAPANYGRAEAQALKITLKIPSAAEVNAILAQLGVPATVPDNAVLGQTITEIVSWDSSETNGSMAHGFADLLSNGGSSHMLETFCDKKKCSGTDAEKSTAAFYQELQGLGFIEVAGAKSRALTNRTALNESAIARVHLTLAPLFAKGGALEPLGDTLASITKQVNDTATSQVNTIVDQVSSTLVDVLDVLGTSNPKVTVGHIQPLPNLATVDLLNLTILGGSANLASGKSTDVIAAAESKVSDISAMGGWLSIDTIEAAASSSVKGLVPLSDRALRIDGINVGGLLGINFAPRWSSKDPVEGLRALLAKRAPAVDQALQDRYNDLLRAVDIVDHVSGISFKTEAGTKSAAVKTVGETTVAGAQADSDVLTLTVAPKIPLLQKAQTPSGGVVPMLGENDYVASGIVLQVTFPRASTAAGDLTAVLGNQNPRTGVGTPMFLAMFLIGAAIVVRRYALTK